MPSMNQLTFALSGATEQGNSAVLPLETRTDLGNRCIKYDDAAAVCKLPGLSASSFRCK